MFIMLVVLFTACKEDEPKEKIDYLKLYKEPNYPKKAAGRFLKSIAYQYPDFPAELNFPFEDGVKVEFFYNSKNYVDHFKIFGSEAVSVGRVVKIEYNLTGLVSRIKYFDADSIILSYELFEYDTQKRLNRISKYELADDQISYELASYNKFTYTQNKIEELRYGKWDYFEHPFKDIYFYDEAGNIKEYNCFAYNTSTPYSSTEYYYNDKKRPFENLGLPVYEIAYDYFQMTEIFSKNHTIGWQSIPYENGIPKVTVIDSTRLFKMVYDSLDYPISRDGSIFYNYVDLK